MCPLKSHPSPPFRVGARPVRKEVKQVTVYYRNPRLVITDAPQPAPKALPERSVTILRELMRGVVESGTGTVLAGVPGEPVFAKTGTAEYGTADPPESHAWIAGWQGDVTPDADQDRLLAIEPVKELPPGVRQIEEGSAIGGHEEAAVVAHP